MKDTPEQLRHATLEAFYDIVTSDGGSLQENIDKIVLAAARLCNSPIASIASVCGGVATQLSLVRDNSLSSTRYSCTAHGPCLNVAGRGDAVRIDAYDLGNPPVCACAGGLAFVSYAGVPVITSRDGFRGVLCVMDQPQRVYDDDDIDILRMLARCAESMLERDLLTPDSSQTILPVITDKFVSRFLHEIRSSLNGILTVSEALFLDIGPNPVYEPYRKHIRAQGKRLSSLLLDTHELFHPIKRSEVRQIEVDALIEGAVAAWRQSQPDATHPVRISGPLGEGNRVSIDEIRVQQAIAHILTNASQHSPAFSPVIVSSARLRGSNVRIDVTDQGSGMPAERIDDAFDPFFSTRQQANGLGLSIAKHILETHGGTVTIHNNTPPPGLTVSIFLSPASAEDDS